MKGKKRLIELFGWYGAVAIVTGYALVSFDQLDPSSLTYQLLNATGALGVLVVSYYKRVYQPVMINIVWLVVAIIALFQLL